MQVIQILVDFKQGPLPLTGQFQALGDTSPSVFLAGPRRRALPPHSAPCRWLSRIRTSNIRASPPPSCSRTKRSSQKPTRAAGQSEAARHRHNVYLRDSAGPGTVTSSERFLFRHGLLLTRRDRDVRSRALNQTLTQFPLTVKFTPRATSQAQLYVTASAWSATRPSRSASTSRSTARRRQPDALRQRRDEPQGARRQAVSGGIR